MIQITIYINTEAEAKKIGESLLKNKLTAYISIDIDNHFYTIDKQNKIVEEKHAVLKIITRALLFNKIEAHIHKYFEKHIKLYAVPISQSNKEFSDYIRHTIPSPINESE
jgi:uncharacterized protein involved in tolerance to divalent cations